MDLVVICLWIVVVVSLVTAYWYLTGPNDLPPGSAGIPVLGCLPFLNKMPHLVFEKLGRKYGNVFHLYIGSCLIVVLNDYEAIHEAFVNQGDNFVGRPEDIIKAVQKLNFGVVTKDGEYWRQHRQFIVTILKDYGVGKLSLQPMLLIELEYCLQEIRNKNGKSFSIRELLAASAANSINILVSGKRFDYDQPIMMELQQRGAASNPPLNLAMFFPWIARLPGPGWLFRHQLIRKVMVEYLETSEKIIKISKEEFNDGQYENYVEAFLTEMNARRKINENEDIFTEQGLPYIVKDLLTAGTVTTSVTMNWAVLYMTIHPDIQKKVQREIDQVIGHQREPSYTDRTKMPYTMATITELYRIVSVLPLGVPHRTTKDTVLLGHTIPKDTVVISNLWAAHHDPHLWRDPHNFRPERFIGPDGQFIRSEQVYPFSIGKRACAGEPLARMEVFLHFVSLLQHFDFVPPDGVMPNLDAKPGFARKPMALMVCAKQRHRPT